MSTTTTDTAQMPDEFPEGDFAGFFGLTLDDAQIPDPLPPEVLGCVVEGYEILVLVMILNARGKGVFGSVFPPGVAAALEAAGLVGVGLGDGHYVLTARGWKTALICPSCPVPPPRPRTPYFCQ